MAERRGRKAQPGPQPDEAWIAKIPSIRGRLIRITSVSDSRVSYEVLATAAHRQAFSSRGGIRVSSLYQSYRRATDEEAMEAMDAKAHPQATGAGQPPEEATGQQAAGSPERHLLRIVRKPGADVVMTIDGKEARVVRIAVGHPDKDVIEVLFDE